MRITFDPNKDRANVLKHGVSLVEASRLDWRQAMTWPDLRHDFGELRMRALGQVGKRIYFVAYVVRDDALRIISMRKANPREVKRYAKKI